MSTLTAAMFPLLLLSPPSDPWLGIYFDMERAVAVVGERIPGSPAAKAGIETGDVLLGVGDVATPTREAFVAAIRAHHAGDTVTIRVRRGDRELAFSVVLGARPRAASPGEAPAPAAPRASEPPAPIAELRAAPAPAPEPTPAPRGYLGLRVQETQAGIFVESALPGSPAAVAGVRAGERLLAVGEQRVLTLGDLERVLQQARAGQAVALTLLSADGTRSVAVTPAAVGGASKPSEAPAAPVGPQGREADLEREIAALRAELAELRRQLEALRRGARE